MLNYLVIMLQFFGLFLLLFNNIWTVTDADELFISPTATPAGIPGFQIISPQPDEVLQGNVPINGSGRTLKDFSCEIEFAYADNPTDTWFQIYYGEIKENQDIFGTWDTTMISDGIYTLRIKFYTLDHKQYMETIPNLRVRNYSSIETPTPEPQNLITQTAATTTPTSFIPQKTTTPFPSNPAQITNKDIIRSIKIGIGFVLVLFFLGFIYTKVNLLFP